MGVWGPYNAKALRQEQEYHRGCAIGSLPPDSIKGVGRDSDNQSL